MQNKYYFLSSIVLCLLENGSDFDLYGSDDGYLENDDCLSGFDDTLSGYLDDSCLNECSESGFDDTYWIVRLEIGFDDT